MFYRAVVFEFGDVVNSRLDAQDNALLVIHFDGSPAHVVFDTCALDTVIELVVGADFGEGAAIEFFAEKHRY